MNKSFKKGNFNGWETLARETLPECVNTIRTQIVPALDSIFVEMLGNTDSVEKETINIYPKFLNEVLESLDCKIEYTVRDFMGDNIPAELVVKDEETIKNAFLTFIPQSVSINTDNGLVSIVFNFPMGE